MINVGILGANGQVGAELALYWANQRDSIRITGLTRSEYGTTLLRLAGVPCETYDVRDPESLRQRFGSFDLVADFSYPWGKATEAISQFRNQVNSIVGAMKPGSAYVSMSSVMAFGMAPSETHVRNRRIARTAYAAIKRAGERDVTHAGRTSPVQCYSFRLGQVHGILQSITQQVRSDMEFADIEVKASETDASIAVFIPTIAQALQSCALGHVQPGVYTVVEQPAWPLQALYRLYERIYSPGASVHYAPRKSTPSFGGVTGWMKRRLSSVRGPLEAYVLTRSEFLYRIAKGWYRRQALPGSSGVNSTSDICHEPLVGTVPGPYVPGLASDSNVIDEYFRSALIRLNRCLHARHLVGRVE